MNKIVSGIALSLMPLLALADEAPVVVPQVEASATGLILFAIIFVGMIGGFAGYIWMKEKARKSTPQQ